MPWASAGDPTTAGPVVHTCGVGASDFWNQFSSVVLGLGGPWSGGTSSQTTMCVRMAFDMPVCDVKVLGRWSSPIFMNVWHPLPLPLPCISPGVYQLFCVPEAIWSAVAESACYDLARP